MSDPEDRVKIWFASEVDRAERDLATSNLRTSPQPRGRRISRLALAGLLVALVVVAVALRPYAPSDLGKGPDRSPATTSAPADQTVYGIDGIPTMLEGQKVLTPEEAAAHARIETTDRPFLVGGWYRSWATGFGCLPDSGTYNDSRILVRQDGCAFFSIDSSDRADGDKERAFAAIESGAALEVNAGDREWGPLVARVHVHDRRAVDCSERLRAECEAMAVIDEILWRPPNFANGIPREIIGEPVMLADAAYGPLTRSDEPQRLLVGGWFSDNPIPCPSQPGAPVSPLLPRCSGAQLSEIPEPGGVTIAIVPDQVAIPRGRVVLRLHTGDPRASDCPEQDRQFCERAIVVDEVAWREPVAPLAGRFLDGIPMAIDGQPVVRAGDARNVADGRTDASVILVGGWYVGPRPVSCPAPMDPHPLAWSCGPAMLGERPGTGALVLGPGPEIPEGPVVIAAHVHDADAAGCLPENRARCQMTIVVDRLVWAGDKVTNTAPHRIQDVVMALQQDIAGFTVEADQPSRTCDPGWPDVSWVSNSATGVTNVLVFPTIADREAVDQNFRSSGWTGIDGCSVDAYVDPWHWVAVDNVMVSTTDALADRTRMRLEGIGP